MGTTEGIMTKTIALALVCALGPAAHAALPENAAVLPAAQGPKLLKQCSRPSISGADSYWTPTAAQIRDLETRLTAYLADEKSPARESARDLPGYYRQYLGVTGGGRKLIYGNFLLRSVMGKKPASLRTEALIACDGGDYFWGIVYDAEKGTFEAPVYNGSMGLTPPKSARPAEPR